MTRYRNTTMFLFVQKRMSENMLNNNDQLFGLLLFPLQPQVVNAGCAPKDLKHFEEELGKFGGDVKMEVWLGFVFKKTGGESCLVFFFVSSYFKFMCIYVIHVLCFMYK